MDDRDVVAVLDEFGMGRVPLAREVVRLRSLAMKAFGILDDALGDTDLDGDESPEFRACLVLAGAISPASVERDGE